MFGDVGLVPDLFGQHQPLAGEAFERPDQLGRPNGSATPLGWAHAEYLELLVTIALAGFPDIVMPARRRYTEGPAQEAAFVWSHKHQITRYQIFSLPRIKDEPPEGKITVLIHGGDEIDQRWSAYRDELDAWESVVAGLLD